MDAAVTRPEVDRRRLHLLERLPNFKGKWLTAYTALWVIVFLLSLVGMARGTYLGLTIQPMWTPYGFATGEDSQGLHVDAVTSPSVRALGLSAGDYVVAVDGWRLPSIAARAAARTRVIKPDGSTTLFTIRKPNGNERELRLTRSRAIEEQAYRDAGVSRGFAMTVNAAGRLLLPTLFIVAAILLFLRRRREAVPAMLSLSFLMFAGIINVGDQLGIGIGAVNLIAAVATSLMFGALFAFPSGRFIPRWTAIAFWSIPLTMLVPADAVTAGTIIGAAFTELAFAGLISRYRLVGTGPERMQLRWAFLGLLAGAVLYLITITGTAITAASQAQDPRWVNWHFAFINPLNGVPLGAMALGLIISILRYRLYDADAVIGRSAAYGLLTVGFVALFAASQKVIELLGQEYLGQNIGALAGGIGAALAAVAIAPMHNRAQRWAERRFQKPLYRLRHGLPALVGDLRETSGLEQVAGATLDSLIEGVRASRAALIVGADVVDAREIPAPDGAAWMKRWSPPSREGVDIDRGDEAFAVRVPLDGVGHGRVGWLLLGARPDGSLFGKSEMDAIEEIAEPVARAVQVAVARQQREAEYDRRIGALEQRLAQVITSIKKPRPSAV